MSELEQIEHDLKEYLTKEPNLGRADRLRYLINIFDKHFTFRKIDHIIDNRDLNIIISQAKAAYIGLNLPISVSKKKVSQTELTQIAMIESIIGYLNKHDLTKKIAKLDYTDSSDEFEGLD